MKGLQTGELAALATAMLWTLSTLAWTSAGRRVGAVAVSFLRMLITCLLLALYCGLVRDRWLPTDADGRTWLLLGLSGLMGFFLSDACGFQALVLIGPRLALLVQSLAPPVAAILSWVFLGEDLTARHWLAMLITLLGITWVVLERPEAAGIGPDERHLISGLALAVVAAATSAVGMVLSREGIGTYDAVAATFIRALGALPGYLLLLSVLARWPSIFAALHHRQAMAIMVVGSVIGPFLGVSLCMVALRHCTAGVVTTLVSTMPVMILPFTILLYREKVSLRAAAGAILAVAGVALMCWR